MESGTRLFGSGMTRRQFAKVAGAVGGAGLLAACGATATSRPAAPTPASQEATKPPEATQAPVATAPAAAAEEVHIVWLTRTSPNENKWENEVAKPEFESKQSAIKVDILTLEQDDIRVKYQAMIAAQEPLDVWSVNWGAGGFGVNHIKLSLLEELTPFIERDSIDFGDYVTDVLNIYNIDGKQWALPFNMRGSYLYYNMTALDDAGLEYPPSDWNDTSWTWDKMVDYATKLTHDYDDLQKAQYGIVITQTLSNPEAMGLMFQVNCWPDEFYTTGTAPEIGLMDPKIVEAFDAQHSLIHELKICPTSGLEQALGELGGTFQSGKMAMLTTGGWGHQQYAGLEKEKFCWGAAPFPWYDAATKAPRSMLYPNPWNITKGSARKEQAWEFLKYLTSLDGERAMMKSVNSCPPIKTLIAEYVGQFPCMTAETMNQAFLGAFDYGRDASDHFALEWADILKVWTNTMDNFLLDESAKAEDYLARAKDEIDKVLQAG
ncbi:MAG: ABC transporter substrate-binding protein [Anaerolineae bacterium]